MKQINYKKAEQDYSLLSTFLSKTQKLLYNKIPIYRDYYLITLILLSITIGSCYSIESDCGDDSEFFWERTSGTPNAYVQEIAVASNGDIWVGSYDSFGSGTYLSTNNGNTWAQKCYFFGYPLKFIAINPVNGYIFVGIDNNGVFRSTDRGNTWVKITNNIEHLDFTDILITPSGEIYFGTMDVGFFPSYRSVYYSSDNGNNWIRKNNDNGLPSYISSLAAGKDGTLYAGTGYGVYRSTDGGDTWLPPSNHTSAIINDLTVSDDGSIFATTFNSDSGVLKSIDGGITWDPTGLSSGFIFGIIYNTITKDIFTYDHSLFGDFNNIYRSTDLGESWELTVSGLPRYSNLTFRTAFAFNHITGQIYTGYGYGVYRSKNYP